MSEQGWEQLTLFQEDSPASRSLLPGSSDQRMTTVTSGRRCLELYKKSGHVGSLVRMCLESSVWHSTRCYLSWKPSGTPAKRLLFRLVPSTPRTDGTESSLWPTMTAGVHGKKRYAQGGKPLTMAIAEKFGEEVTLTPEFAEWMMGYEQEFTKLLPTPVASDCKGASANRFYTHTQDAVPPSTIRTGRAYAVWETWPVEPDVGRVAHGVPHRVDRLKCLGNAVVPQAFYPIFKFIREVEEGL